MRECVLGFACSFLISCTTADLLERPEDAATDDAEPDDAEPDDAEPAPDYRVVLGQSMPIALVADETAVYWLDAGYRDGDGDVHLGAVLAWPHGGGEPRVIAGGVDGGGGLALDGDRLYWTAAGDHAIRSARTDSTDVQTIALDDDAYEIAISGDRIVWREAFAVRSAAKDGSDVRLLTDDAGDPRTLAADATYAYWVTPDARIVRAPTDGAGAIEDVSSDRLDEHLYATGTELWAATTAFDETGDFVAQVTRIDLASGVAVEVAREPGGNPRLAVDGAAAFYSVEAMTGPSGSALRTATSGPATPTTLAAEQPHVSAVAVTDAYVYWATYDVADPAHGGTISRLAR